MTSLYCKSVNYQSFLSWDIVFTNQRSQTTYKYTYPYTEIHTWTHQRDCLESGLPLSKGSKCLSRSLLTTIPKIGVLSVHLYIGLGSGRVVGGLTGGAVSWGLNPPVNKLEGGSTFPPCYLVITHWVIWSLYKNVRFGQIVALYIIYLRTLKYSKINIHRFSVRSAPSWEQFPWPTEI